jgi:hypothetical protein
MKMPKKLNLSPLSEPDRSQSLEKFLAALDRHPDLAHFRAAARTGPERQLALFAALERAVLVGSPAASPPRHDDNADQLLCDILDAIDRHPELQHHGSAYGPDRHLANLQAFGVWRGTTPLTQPSARELFTTAFSDVTTGPASDLPSLETNNSPAPQGFSPNGDLIGLSASPEPTSDQSPHSPQTVDGVLVVSIVPATDQVPDSSAPTGIIHHATETPGEQFAEVPADPRLVPTRPLRRGRLIALDDLAKGRLLGLMSYGLSFRQAAAQLGVHHVTLLNALKRDEEFAQQVSEARLDAISQPLLTVIQASRTNWRAARAPPRSGGRLAKFLHERRVSSYETTPEERALQSKR